VIRRTFQSTLIYHAKAKITLRYSENFSIHPYIPCQDQNNVAWFGELFNRPLYTMPRPKYRYMIRWTFQFTLIYHAKTKITLRDSENFSIDPYIPFHGKNNVTWFGELFNSPLFTMPRPKQRYVIRRTFQSTLLYHFKAKITLPDLENFSIHTCIPFQGQYYLTWFR
jgi:hypothetical protein